MSCHSQFCFCFLKSGLLSGQVIPPDKRSLKGPSDQRTNEYQDDLGLRLQDLPWSKGALHCCRSCRAFSLHPYRETIKDAVLPWRHMLFGIQSHAHTCTTLLPTATSETVTFLCPLCTIAVSVCPVLVLCLCVSHFCFLNTTSEEGRKELYFTAPWC